MQNTGMYTNKHLDRELTIIIKNQYSRQLLLNWAMLSAEYNNGGKLFHNIVPQKYKDYLL